jgi:hypothetical protein
MKYHFWKVYVINYYFQIFENVYSKERRGQSPDSENVIPATLCSSMVIVESIFQLLSPHSLPVVSQ